VTRWLPIPFSHVPPNRFLAKTCGLVVGAAAIYAIVTGVQRSVPFEDAAMLMRYAQHVAAGYGMVWNVGDPPVDGATDFLFTALVALVMRAGLSVESATRACILTANLALSVAMLSEAIRWRLTLLPLAAASAIYMVSGPGNRFLQAYFGAPAFALTAVALYFALQHAEEQSSNRAVLVVAAAALAAGLMRPEGNLLAAMLFASFWLTSDSFVFRRVLARSAMLYCVAGALFLGWRTWYFGQLMPNPFYLKGGWRLYPESLSESIRNAWDMLRPFVPIMLVAGLVRFRVSQELHALREILPIAGFLLIWVLLNNDNNHWGRFQYAIVPLMLLGALRWTRLLYQRALEGGRASVCLVLCATSVLTLAAVPAYSALRYGGHLPPPDGRFAVARGLQPLASTGMVMAVSEAGLLPLYSEWNAIDVWGLNDQWIARNHVVTEAYLDRRPPDLVMLNEDTWPNRSARWQEMIDRVLRYVRQRQYILAARYERGYSIHYYFVRPGAPHAAEIIRACRPDPYIWWLDSEPIASTATAE